MNTIDKEFAFLERKRLAYMMLSDALQIIGLIADYHERLMSTSQLISDLVFIFSIIAYIEATKVEISDNYKNLSDYDPNDTIKELKFLVQFEGWGLIIIQILFSISLLICGIDILHLFLDHSWIRAFLIITALDLVVTFRKVVNTFLNN